MKIPHFCSQCLFGSKAERKFVGDSVPLADRGIFWFKCERGHEEVTILQVPTFEVLFENGLYAITDDYYREAISSFVASLEKFYEYYIEVIFRKNNVGEDEIEEFKSKNNRSEKKVGAFFSIYVNENNEIPKVLSSKENEFRNEVIHNGKIPTKKQSIEWGENIRALIHPIAQQVSKKYSEKYYEVERRDLSRRYQESAERWPGAKIMTMSFGTEVSPWKGNKVSIEGCLEEVEKRKRNLEKGDWKNIEIPVMPIIDPDDSKPADEGV